MLDATTVTIIISIISIAASLFIKFLMEKYGGKARMKEIQQTITKINKEYQKAMKEKNKQRIKELEPEMEKSSKLMFESTMLSFKSLIIVLPVFMIVRWVIITLFPEFLITLPFNIPVPFRNGELLTWEDTFGPNGWFIISLVVFGGLSQIIISKLCSKSQDKSQENPQNKSQENPQNKSQENP